MKYISFLFFATIFLFGCSKNKDHSLNFELVKLDSIKLDENGDHKIGWARFSKLGDDNLLYIVDWSTNTIKIFDSKGNYCSSISKSGKSPEELSKAMSFSVYKNKVYIGDFANDAIKIFSKEGVFIKQLRVTHKESSIKIYIGCFTVLSENEIWYPGVDNNMLLGSPVTLIDSNGKITRQVGYYPKYFKNTDWGLEGSLVATDGKRYVVAFVASPAIIVGDVSTFSEIWIDLDEKKQRYISEGKPLRYDGDLDKARIRATKESHNDFIEIYNDTLIIRAYYFPTQESMKMKSLVQRRNFLEIYNLKGDFFGEMKLPGRLCDKRQDTLLIEESDEPDNRQFGLYKIVFPNSK
jgi:hypothetical protein